VKREGGKFCLDGGLIGFSERGGRREMGYMGSQRRRNDPGGLRGNGRGFFG